MTLISAIIARYERLSTPLVYDILDKLGLPNQSLACDVQPIDPTMRIVGPAFTISGEERSQDDGAAGYAMFREIVAGSVLVMASNGHLASGPWGENASISSQMKGAKGLVTDCRVRDSAEIVALGFPVFSRGLTPVFMGGRWAVTGHQRPVKLAAQLDEQLEVRPGDLVVADRDGVVIVPAQLAEEVLVAAEKLNEIEELLREGLRAGEDRETVYKRHPKFAHLRKRA